MDDAASRLWTVGRECDQLFPVPERGSIRDLHVPVASKPQHFGEGGHRRDAAEVICLFVSALVTRKERDERIALVDEWQQDMSFANQALSVRHLVTTSANLEPAVYPVPPELDKEVGRLKLDAMGIRIDTLTADQQIYLTSWEMGT